MPNRADMISINRHYFFLIYRVYKQQPAPCPETECQTGTRPILRIFSLLPINYECSLKGLNQAKIVKKTVILFWLFKATQSAA